MFSENPTTSVLHVTENDWLNEIFGSLVAPPRHPLVGVQESRAKKVSYNKSR